MERPWAFSWLHAFKQYKGGADGSYHITLDQNEILALLNAGAHDGDSVDGNTG
ncbi:hypothetical protein THER5_0705 [Bifidobacterium thermacidophilum subsp. thermacidophilum]|jgi:hypothetical protein|uniref:Uncharacterized protein n=1 Tax=Bifidobacterium thermacidophilum subsp. thermacidophilum TaxID=79262 RepID=A0A087E647_9BIFI|nr:hypothetical protein THER5_0705 [Bifidobacterium thermacidophilum subsp. thermacidophilum]